MKIKNTLLQIEDTYPIHAPYSKGEVLFFDIETTGFSAKTSYVYLIGCMYYKEETWQIIQWLNTEPLKESEFILAFFDFLKDYRRLIHYNGSGFDIPYLQKKAEMYGLADPFTLIESVDLYKLILPLKKLLSFESARLKAIESYLHLKRIDTYSGEELISLYSSYLGRLTYERLALQSASVNNSSNPSAGDLENILLLHNLEDIKNLPAISGLLYYKDILEYNALTNPQSLTTCRIKNEQNHILLLCQLPFLFPADFTVTCPLREKVSLKVNQEIIEGMELVIDFRDNTIIFHIPVYTGTLKYYLTPPSDYYYLPLEDMAVHKSVSQYVDKEYRKKATPSTCYIKKNGCFIPYSISSETSKEIIFKKNYSDKITYIESEKLKEMTQKELAAFGEQLLLFIKNYYHL